MSMPRLLALPLLISVAVVAQAQRAVSGCTPPPDQCPAVIVGLARENVPVQFRRSSDDDRKNLTDINLACITPPTAFRVHNSTQPDGGKVNSPELDRQLFRTKNLDYCGFIHFTHPPKVKQTVTFWVNGRQVSWDKLYEETMQNVEKYAKKNSHE